MESRSEAPSELPWKLRVHFDAFPTDKLIRTHNGIIPDVAWDLLFNSLKEADFMRHGSAKRVMTLPRKEMDELWKGVTEGDWKLCAPVREKLAQGGRGWPVRIHLGEQPVIQDLVPLVEGAAEGGWSWDTLGIS